MVDVEPHPQEENLIKEININKITNKQIRRFLNLKNEGYDQMDALGANVLQSYFGEYSTSAKAYKTQGGNDEFFQEVAKF